MDGSKLAMKLQSALIWSWEKFGVSVEGEGMELAIDFVEDIA